MSKLLDDYLSDVQRYLKPLPPPLREAELQEIAGHIEQLIGALESEGHSSQEAAILAVERFGPARTVALNLRDVWEANQGPYKVWFAVIAGNWLTLLLLTMPINRALFGIAFQPQLIEAIRPILLAWFFIMPVMQPFLFNFLFGWWGGRRAVAPAIVSYLSLYFLFMTRLTPVPEVQGMTLTFLGIFGVMAAIAGSGAYAGALWHRKQRFSIVGNGTLTPDESALRALRHDTGRLNPRHLRPIIAILTLMAAMGVAGFLITKQRINAVLHPATPEKAVQVMLSAPGFNFDEMAPSTNVSLRPLPPQTPAEKAGLVKRIAYSATMHATPNYRAQRLAYLKKQERAIQEGRPHHHELPALRAAMARLRPEGYKMRGIVKVVKAPDGWHVNTRSGTANRTWAWIYDIYYEEPK